ncbi:hypothetical protein D3P96_07910 [Weissella viridescens]|uniref:TPR repeat-containing protein n=1 Tax=Weissella viridescens TaxID=1629 RepID=A0A3P2R9F7_WEIVI|nr:hypothetical protein [Weissella viridescens]RRG17397.1 hypothetical protein D3P96_07910 [Weissella viridescens]
MLEIDKAELQKLGDQALAENDDEHALMYFEEAYRKEQTFDLNVKLAKLYLQQEQNEAANDLVHEYSTEYGQSDPEKQQLYIESCLKSSAFIDARQFIYLNHLHSNLVEQITVAEADFRENQQTALLENQKAFYHLSDAPMGQQSQVVRRAKHLPLTEFLFCAKYILIDPFAHQLSRVSVLEELMKLGVEEQINMINLLGSQEAIVPKQIPFLAQQNKFKAIMDLLEKSPLANDPTQFEILKQQINLCLMLMMPNLDQAILDVKVWTEQTLLMFGMEFMTNTEEVGVQKEWRDALNQALMTL